MVRLALCSAAPAARMLVVAMLAGPWPVAAQAQAPAPTPTPSAGAGSTLVPNPAVEDQFIKAVEDARVTFTTGLNDLVRGVARPRRAEALCRVLPKARAENWAGKVVVLGSSAGGRGVVAIEIAPKVVLATNRTDALDEKDKTLIDVRSPLFAYAAVLAVGDRVQFSGTLIQVPGGGEDCFKEVGRDIMSTMTTPEFVIRLDAMKKVTPPSANAVLSGQAPAMSIAQSSDYVRDAVDIIAGGVACGAESRRVFAIIIKVLIRATAGQPNDQRDALIGLMFTPPSASAQTKENCDAKQSGLDRLESESS